MHCIFLKLEALQRRRAKQQRYMNEENIVEKFEKPKNNCDNNKLSYFLSFDRQNP